MARKKCTSPHCRDTLPIPVPKLDSLPLWCLMIYSSFLASITKIFHLRTEITLLNANLAAYVALLKECADFLRTTSVNSNWPSSVTSSPIMMRGRHLLEKIQSTLGIGEEEKRTPDIKTKEDNVINDNSSGGEMTNSKASLRQARHPGATQKIRTPDEVINVEPGKCHYCHGSKFTRTGNHSLYQVVDVVLKSLVKHYLIWECTCEHCGRHVRAEIPSEAVSGLGSGITATVGLLTSLGVSRRKIQTFFKQTCDI